MNRVELSAQIIERKALRYTPAGLPALDLVLAHESEVTEAQQSRQVKLELRAVALGPMAELLNRMDAGKPFRLTGFLGAPRNGRGVLLHITDIHDIV
ncbi:primosomal replication protein N [Aquabacterium sp. A3]|uniref:primosomal replication protein N n=1 Tax=Aquabacterium sp. A3 TaxID=3132829 RepID=UPI003119FD3A